MNLLGPPEAIQTKQIKIQPVKIIEGNACMGHKQNSDCADNSKLGQKAKGVDSFLESLTDQITGWAQEAIQIVCLIYMYFIEYDFHVFPCQFCKLSSTSIVIF